MALLPDAGIETIEDKLKTVLKLRLRYRQRHPSFDELIAASFLGRERSVQAA
jgi:hypothetical protein